MSILKETRGQGSVEFVMITGIMFFVIMGMAVAMQIRLSNSYKEQAYVMMDELGNLINTEVRLAYETSGDYTREFNLPEEIGTYNYSVALYDKTEVVITSVNIDYIIFLDTDVEGSLAKGKNLITKNAGVITISS